MKIRYIYYFLVFACFSLKAYEPLPVTPYAVVGFQEKRFYDDFHKIRRSLLIWYPVDAKTTGTFSNNLWDVFKIAQDAPIKASEKLPLIVISYGENGNPHHMSWLIRGLVHSGFIVIGIEHLDKLDGERHVNYWLRALDIKVMIDQFKLLPFSENASLNKIGVAGYSLGGAGALWVSGGRATTHSIVPGTDYASPDFFQDDSSIRSLDRDMLAKDWRDSRVKAAFIMAPSWSWLFDEQSLRQIKIPIYLIAPSEDKVIFTKNNAGSLARRIPMVFYQEIPGRIDHYVFISALNESKRKEIQLDFMLQDDPSIDRHWIQEQVVEEAVNFFNWAFKPILD